MVSYIAGRFFTNLITREAPITDITQHYKCYKRKSQLNKITYQGSTVLMQQVTFRLGEGGGARSDSEMRRAEQVEGAWFAEGLG